VLTTFFWFIRSLSR